MAHVKAPVQWVPDPEFRRESDEITRVFKEAVAEERDANRRLGIPNVQVDKDGRLTEEQSDGTIRVLETPLQLQTPPVAKK